tara:strand:+ start:83 stop:214 length:132 start_codon:yes stop_codon:yes gene_type:complete
MEDQALVVVVVLRLLVLAQPVKVIMADLTIQLTMVEEAVVLVE